MTNVAMHEWRRVTRSMNKTAIMHQVMSLSPRRPNTSHWQEHTRVTRAPALLRRTKSSRKPYISQREKLVIARQAGVVIELGNKLFGKRATKVQDGPDTRRGQQYDRYDIRAPTGPGNMILQRSMIFQTVL